MKVSIITIAYNAEETIRDTIQSVINQDYADIEYIIIVSKVTVYDRTANLLMFVIFPTPIK